MGRRLSFRSRLSSLIALILTSLNLFAFPLTTYADEHHHDPIRLQLRWQHQFQFAGYYAALEQGYYAEADLDVLILEGGPDKNVINRVLDGEADYGVTNSELLLHRLNGHPLVALAAVVQHSPLVFISRETTITTPQDFAGKTIMMSGGSSDIELQATLRNEGITADQYSLIEGVVQKHDYFRPEIAIFAAYSTNEPFYYHQAQIPYTQIKPSTYGVDFYGDCLFTTESQINNHPDQVRAFREASLKGWQYALSHADELVQIIHTRYKSEKELDHLLFESEELKKLIMPELVQIGYMNPERWKHIAETFARLEYIPDRYSIDGFLYSPNSQPVGFSNISKTLVISICVLSLSFFIIFLFNRRLKREISARKKSENALQRSEQKLLDFSRQTEQFSLSAAAMLTINDENQLITEISKAIVEHSDYKRVLISLFKNTPPYRQLIGYAGVTDEIVEKVRNTDLAKNWYNNVFSLGIKVGSFSYYVPHTLSHILNQKATIYGEEPEPESENRWHPKDNLFVRMSDENGKFLGIISVDTSKSGTKPTEETVRPLEIYASLISQIIILRREYKRRTHLEEQLQQSKKCEELGDLTEGIAHDFNNILGIIIGNAELALLDSPDWNPVKRNVHEIKSAGLRAKDIIQQLLAFSSRQNRELSNVHLESLLKDTLKLLRSTLPANISLDFQSKLNSAYISADPPLIYQVLHNLCTNAAQAIGNDKGRIEVNAIMEKVSHEQGESLGLSAGNYARIDMSDTGCGIPEDQISRIFDPYFTTKDSGEASGLGLSTVHGIIKSHNGAIQVTGKPEEKTTFTVYLPCRTVPPGSSPEYNDQQQIVESNRRKTVLIVDNEPALLAINKDLLERAGYKVIVHSNPLLALDHINSKSSEIDLVITDLTMPEMSGTELARAIDMHHPQIPIFLCTGHIDKISKDSAIEASVSKVFLKPLDTEQFLNEVHQTLQNF